MKKLRIFLILSLKLIKMKKFLTADLSNTNIDISIIEVTKVKKEFC